MRGGSVGNHLKHQIIDQQCRKENTMKNKELKIIVTMLSIAAAFIFIIGPLTSIGIVKAEENKGSDIHDSLKGFSVGILGYIDYSNGQKALPDNKEADYNAFKLTRGYFTVQKKMTGWFGMRGTLDITQDATGDYKYRTKYLYAEFKPGNFGFMTNMVSEFGLGHIPWLDFEEHVNPFRCQGTMATERAGIFNSSDT